MAAQIRHYTQAYALLGKAYDIFRLVPPEDRDIETLAAIAEAAGHIARKVKALKAAEKRRRKPRRRKRG